MTQALVLTLAIVALTVAGCTKPAERSSTQKWEDIKKKATPAENESTSAPETASVPVPVPAAPAAPAPNAEASPAKRELLTPKEAPPAPKLGKKATVPSAPAPKSVPVPIPRALEVKAPTSQLQLSTAKFENETQKGYFSNFLTGREYCAQFKAITKNENGRYIKVPVSYEDRSKGETEIYAFFASGQYDAKLPTVIMIDGGPGQASHGMPRVSQGFNELHFDQRGAGCSHPESLELYRYSNFYSSMNTARDIEELRKAYDLEKVSIYGVSYGTIPATIYANQFASRVSGVVLEGTMFSASSIEVFSVVNFNLKKTFDKLPEPTKEAMRVYFKDPQRYVSLFQLARVLMYTNVAFDQLTQFLLDTFPSPDKINTALAEQYLNADLGQKLMFASPRMNAVEVVVNRALICREIQPEKMSLTTFVTEPGQKEFNKITLDLSQDTTCKLLGFNAYAQRYEATQYPISVPVTYIHGGWDGATSTAGAVQHFKKVPTGKKQMLIAVKGGHTPLFASMLLPDDSRLRKSAIPVYEKALRGEFASPEEVKAMNDAQEDSQLAMSWKQTTK